MSEAWPKRKIADLVEPLTTVDPRKNPEEDFRYIDVSAVSRETHKITGANLLAGKDAPSRARRLAQSGDVLFATIRPTLKRIAQVPKEYHGAVCSTGFYILRPKKEILTRFLFYSLFSEEFSNSMNELQRGASYPAVSDGDVKSRLIPVPPITQQKRIVSILDEAFAGIETAIANTEKNLANARELFESYLTSSIGNHAGEWEELTLKEVCLDYGRGKSKHRPRNDPKLYGGKYPFIQTGDVRHSDHLITTYSSTYNDTGLAQSKLWPKGTICITIAANIAETGVLDFEACFPDSIIGLVVNPSRASNAYVEFLLQSVKAVLKAKGKGSAQDNINLGTFEKEKFPFPPLETQLKIVSDVAELRGSILDLEIIYGNKLNALAELKQSLLQKAFSGELTADKLETEVEQAAA